MCINSQPRTNQSLYLIVFKSFDELFAGVDEHDASAVVGLMVKLHLRPGHIQLLQTK